MLHTYTLWILSLFYEDSPFATLIYNVYNGYLNKVDQDQIENPLTSSLRTTNCC